MNNWHRRIWTLDEIAATSPIAALFDADTPNQFWLEPFADPTDNKLRFRVQFAPDAMAECWSNCVLEPKGSDAFPQDSTPGDTTERLEGTVETADGPLTLQIYLTMAKDREELRLRKKTAISIGDGDTGFARGH
jgi:hypothetical protein